MPNVLIVGGGIVGLATAYTLTRRRPPATVTVLEKEPALARHQTGRNSGVLHSGIYYTPGSHKAVTCRAGKKAMEAFCAAEGLPYETCGKVIIATGEDERPRLHRLCDRGRANGVRCTLIGAERMRELEPHAAGLEAIHVPEAGIVDFVAVCLRLAQRVEEAGGRVVRNARVQAIHVTGTGVSVETPVGALTGEYLINCAGLHADRVAAMAGTRPDARIVPFRGEYFALRPGARHLCRNLIYPLPDPSFPFLGVHFTRLIQGGVECGPNAVPALAREGYTKTSFSPHDLAELLGYPGFRRLARTYWRTGLGEMWRSLSKRAFVRALQRLVPEVRAADLITAPAGVRAQALRPDGALVDDFLISESPRVVHVLNAPSPAATASLCIAEHIVDALVARFD